MRECTTSLGKGVGAGCDAGAPDTDEMGGGFPARRCPRLSVTAVAAVRRAIQCTPRLSIRRLSVKTGLSQTRVHRILRQQLRLYPYKLQLTQRLHRGDKAKRLRFCRWILGKWGSPSFRRSLLFSDEAHFYINGQVTSRASGCGCGARLAITTRYGVVWSVFTRNNWPLLPPNPGED